MSEEGQSEKQTAEASAGLPLSKRIRSMKRAGAPLIVWNEKHHLHNGTMAENAGRLDAVIQKLERCGLLEQCSVLQEAHAFTEATVLALGVHTAQHLAKLRGGFIQQSTLQWFCGACTFANVTDAESCAVCEAVRPPTEQAFVIPEHSTSVYLCPDSLQVALRSCSLCVEAARRVWAGAAGPSAIALVRPPGHHAASESFGSYCLLNTIVIAAKSLLEMSSGGPGRILIVDWDIHHGDGTQALLDADPKMRESCLFISIHRHDDSFWPKSGAVSEGSDSIVNVPLRGSRYGDADYFAVFKRVVLPLAAEFGPDMLLVSAGYDCAEGDAIGRFSVTPLGFKALTQLLLAVCPAHLFVLEGGYDVDGASDEPHGPLCEGVAATVQGLLDGPLAAADLSRVSEPCKATEDVIAEVLTRCSDFKWRRSVGAGLQI